MTSQHTNCVDQHHRSGPRKGNKTGPNCTILLANGPPKITGTLNSSWPRHNYGNATPDQPSQTTYQPHYHQMQLSLKQIQCKNINDNPNVGLESIKMCRSQADNALDTAADQGVHPFYIYPKVPSPQP